MLGIFARICTADNERGRGYCSIVDVSLVVADAGFEHGQGSEEKFDRILPRCEEAGVQRCFQDRNVCNVHTLQTTLESVN